MNGLAIAAIGGIPLATVALGAIIGRLERRYRRQQRQDSDWPEDEWPSPYGWAGREDL